MNLQDLRYFVAVAEHRHFGLAAKACRVSQPTLSGQLRKLEDDLGVALFERTHRRVAPTQAGEKLLVHARRVLQEAGVLEETARAFRDELAGPFKLGVIPTLAPYLIPLVYGPLRKTCPQLTLDLWEDLTGRLVELLRGHRLEAALLATDVQDRGLTSIPLFVEPFLAALPASHPLSAAERVNESDLASDLLVLADGHCLADQALAACGRKRGSQGSFRAASLDTLVQLVASGHGTTLVPALATGVLGARGISLRPLVGRTSRTVRLVTRVSFPRPKVLRIFEKTVRWATAALLSRGAAPEVHDAHHARSVSDLTESE